MIFTSFITYRTILQKLKLHIQIFNCKNLILATALCCIFLVSKGQTTEIDSLENLLLTHTEEDTMRVNILYNTAFQYFRLDIEKSMQYATKTAELAEKLNFKKGKAWSLRIFGIIYDKKGDSTKTSEYFQEALEINEELNDKQGISKMLRTLGRFYENQTDYNKALNYYQKAFQLSEELGDKIEKATYLDYIGNIYQSQGNPTKALDYHQKALKLREQTEDKNSIIYSLNSIGSIYWRQDEYSIALDYYQKALQIAEELGDKKRISRCLNYVGLMFWKQTKYTQALEYYHKGLQMSEEIGYKKGILVKINNIGVIYRDQGNYPKALEYLEKAAKIAEDDYYKAFTNYFLGDVYLKSGNLKKAKYHAQKGYEFANRNGKFDQIKEASEILSKVYNATGEHQKAYTYLLIFKQMTDSLINENNTKALTRLAAEYEFQQEKDSISYANKIKQEALERDIEKRELTQRGTFIGLGFSGVLIFTLFLFFRIKQRDNKLLKRQSTELENTNEELLRSNEEIKTMNDDLFSANEELNSLNDTLNVTYNTIQHQRDQILSSIQYAKRIQDAIIPNPEYLKNLIPNHFVFFKPRDVVSGDFYWCTTTESKPIYEEQQTFEGKHNVFKGFSSEKIVLTAVDCTGHGVPGAFMSMVGNTLLNNIVKEKHIEEADRILEELNKGVRQVLKQRETKNRDGMDLALVVIDFTNKTLEFAGAKNPLVYIQNNELKMISGDRRAIGGHQREKEKPFTKHTLSFENSPITFYIFSDGYQDQFGGHKNRKFMSKNLRELLFKIHKKSMEEQQLLLAKQFEDWKGGGDQIDDVLVMGVSI